MTFGVGPWAIRRARGILASQVNGDHVREGIDIKTVLDGAVTQGRGYGDRKLLEKRVQDGEARDHRRLGDVAAIHFVHGGCVNRSAQVNLQNLGVAGVLPVSHGVTGREAEAARADQGFLSRAALDSSRYGGGAAKVIDQRRMPDGGLGRLKRGFLKDGGVKRTPADRLAMRDQAIIGAERTTVRLGNRKNGI